ncbi:nicotianamine aminotransferase 1-like isoform X1 [Carex rostrata]
MEQKWNFKPSSTLLDASSLSVRSVLSRIMGHMETDASDLKPVIPLGHGDPSSFPCFSTTPSAVDAVSNALRSGKFNSYAPGVGVLSSRIAIAEYMSRDLPYALSPDDIYMTNGCSQAIEIITSVLARPGANILLPRPGYLFYEARAVFNRVEARYFDLVPEKGWEVDLDGLTAIADENTVAMVIVNPGNPCGNVFSYEHLAKATETAKKLGIFVITDEVYGHLTFGSKTFVPMGAFSSTVPVITLGSISKRWVVPGWRLGWIALNDPNGILKHTKVVDCMKSYLDISTDPATFIQGAISDLIANTNEDFFLKTVETLKMTAEICYNKLKEIKCINCPCKPEGSMFLMVRLDLSQLADIKDDMDFCCQLAKEEHVIILPGCAVGFKNWLRITHAIEPSSLDDGLTKLKSFCEKHAK